MRKLLLVGVLALILVNVVLAQGRRIPAPDLEWRESGSRYVVYYRGDLFSGTMEERYGDNAVEVQTVPRMDRPLHVITEFRDGKKDGLERLWYENGQLYQRLSFSNNLEDGLFEQWYENGQLAERKVYFAGVVDGPVSQWLENGQVVVAEGRPAFEGTGQSGASVSGQASLDNPAFSGLWIEDMSIWYMRVSASGLIFEEFSDYSGCYERNESRLLETNGDVFTFGSPDDPGNAAYQWTAKIRRNGDDLEIIYTDRDKITVYHRADESRYYPDYDEYVPNWPSAKKGATRC